MNLRFDQNLFGYLIISIFIVIIISSMWEESVVFSEERSLLYETYYDAAKWLSDNLEENQTALLPNTQVFWSLDESLMKQTKDYADVWKLTGITLRSNTTDAEILVARDHLREYIKDDSQLKYLVIDWVDKHGRAYFVPRDCEQFDKSLQEVANFVFLIPIEDRNWKGGVIICEIN